MQTQIWFIFVMQHPQDLDAILSFGLEVFELVAKTALLKL